MRHGAIPFVLLYLAVTDNLHPFFCQGRQGGTRNRNTNTDQDRPTGNWFGDIPSASSRSSDIVEDEGGNAYSTPEENGNETASFEFDSISNSSTTTNLEAVDAGDGEAESSIDGIETMCASLETKHNASVNSDVAKEPFADLSRSERTWISGAVTVSLDLQGRDSKKKYYDQDSITSTTLEPANKREMIAYLDNGGPMPLRYARVFVIYGISQGGDMMEYRVGPLPFPEFNATIANATASVDPLTERGELRGFRSSRQRSYYMRRYVTSLISKSTMKKFFIEAFGSRPIGGNVRYTHQEGNLDRDEHGVTVSWWRSNADNTHAVPLPFKMRVTIKEMNDTDTWTATDVYYYDQQFDTLFDFMVALAEKKVEIKPQIETNSNPFWSTLLRRPTDLRGMHNDDPPPSSVEPVRRFTVKGGSSSGGGRVDWLGWSFHFVDRRRHGLAVFDVSFLKERIAYEIGLQELHATYTGYQPNQSNQFFYDSMFALGAKTGLKRGVDCPEHAEYFGNVCVFEHDEGQPLWRKDRTYRYYAGAKGTVLIVRSTVQLGNYDYVTEYKFHLDGQIDVGFGASGHMWLSSYYEKEEPFGTRVQEDAFANLHSHYAGFKVDLDIGSDGTKNCVEKTSVVYKERNDIQGLEDEPPKSWLPSKTISLERTIVQTEEDARVISDPTKPASWRVVSCDEHNKWGYPRGYEIVHPNTPVAFYDQHHPGFPAYQSVHAVRKEEEPFLVGPMEVFTRREPTVPIEGPNGLSNGESLMDTDVVTWMSLGFYHIPRAEDNPVTNVVRVHFSLRPNNYFDENSSLDLGQVRRERGKAAVDEVPKANCEVQV